MTSPTDIHKVEYAHQLVGLQIKDQLGTVYDVLDTDICRDVSSDLLSAYEVVGVKVRRRKDNMEKTLSLTLLKECHVEILSGKQPNESSGNRTV